MIFPPDPVVLGPGKTPCPRCNTVTRSGELGDISSPGQGAVVTHKLCGHRQSLSLSSVMGHMNMFASAGRRDLCDGLILIRTPVLGFFPPSFRPFLLQKSRQQIKLL